MKQLIHRQHAINAGSNKVLVALHHLAQPHVGSNLPTVLVSLNQIQMHDSCWSRHGNCKELVWHSAYVSIAASITATA